MVREILKLRTDNGLANNPTFHDIELTEYSFRSPRMGMPTLTATLMWPTCLDDEWTGKEYVEFRGEKYYIRQVQSSEKGNGDTRYQHSLEFKSEREQLAHVFFYDVVPSWSATYDKPNTNSTEFKFFGTLREFADRINCALRYAGIGDSILNTKTTLTDTDTPVGDGYCVVVSGYGGADLTISKELSFTDQYLWDALAEGFNRYEVPFAFRDKKIVFNEYVEVTDHVFKYGYDNSLLSVKKVNANARIINRITFKGSSENIPYYYPNETEYGHISLAPLSTNKVLTANSFSLFRPNRLVGVVTSGQSVTLQSSKRISISFGSMQYYNGSSYQTLQYGKWYEVNNSLASGNTVEYKYRTTFTLASAGDAAISSVIGQLWMTDKVYPNAAPTVADNLINGETFKVTALTKGSDSYLGSVRVADNQVVLSKLPAGTYTIDFTVSWRFSLHAFWQINSISSASAGTTEYYWSIGDKRVKDLSSIGVSFNGALSDGAVGDGFGWTASGLMPFQTNLMPPKYRQTSGAERFYNALNNTYPASGGGYLTFKNPFVAGNPNEYIHIDETVKPTIKGITNAAGQAFGVIAGLAYDSDDNDSIKNVSDDKDKNDAANYEHSFFYIKLNRFDGPHAFDLFNSASQTDPMTIQMTSGKCDGCKFKIQVAEFTDGDIEIWKNPVQVTGSNGDIVAGSYEDKVNTNNPQDFQQDTTQNSIWICVQKDASTFGTIMPNRTHNYMPAVGDTFNIINIELPQGYITAAESLGEKLMLDFMADNNEEKFNFDIAASRIFFAENKELLAALDENSRIKVKYDDKTYVQYVSEFGIDCKDNEALPDVKLSLANTLTAGSSFVEEVVAKAVDAASVLGGRGGGAGGGLTTELADARYLRRDKADRTEHRLSSDTALEVGSFVSGSSGGILFVDPDTGHSTLEVDFIKARMKAMFETLEIAHVQSIGGKLIISPGGSVVISFVEERANAYRCYFKQQEEEEGADCRFIVGDDCYCQSFNISAGTHHNASNQFYWRAVTAVSNSGSYIELSKTDCAAQSGVPQVGDTICQLGSDDETRQSAIVLSTVDTASPNVTLYDGITNFTLAGKEVVDYGVDPTTNKAYFHVYGNAYIGDKEGQSYVKYDNLLKKMEIKAMLSIQSTIGDDSLEDYIKKVSPPVKQEDIEDFVNAIVDPKIDGIQNQIDGVIETWFYEGVPTLTNYPASGWNTNDLKIAHLGDLYYDNDTGTAYRFSQNTDGSYYWNKITDEAITKALAAAQKAQDTADGKRRVFTSQPTNADTYDIGDLWVNATYGTQYTNDILRCIAHKDAGVAFSITHWTLASKYTDDTALNNFIADYQDTIKDIETQIDGKAETWYQSTNPANAWTTAEAKAAHKGDLWYCTADIAGTNYKKGTTWYWNGTAWEQQNIPQSVFDTIDGKSAIYVAKPTSGYKKNDLWFLEADYTLSGVAYKSGTLVVAIRDMGTAWSANDWVKKDRYTDDTLAQQAKAAADKAQADADKAEADAKAAKDRLDQWAADGVISPTEKQAIKDEIARIDADKAHITAEYTRYGIGTPTAYNNAYTTYRAQLVSLSAATPENITIPSNFASNQTAYYNARTAALSKIAEEAKKYAENIAKQEAEKAVAGYKYLKEALGDVTTIAGGLMLSSQIRLGQHNADFTTQTTWAGHNGVYDNGRTIGSWWGGDMIDRFDANDNRLNVAGKRYATALIRMDGSAYFANGNIQLKANGSAQFGLGDTAVTITSDGSVKLGNGILIDIGGQAQGLGNSIASVTTVVNAMQDVLVPVNDAGARVPWAQATRVKSTLPFYSESWISARGVGSSAGGSSGGGTAVNLLTSWGDYTAAMATTHALSAGLGYDLYTRVGALEGGGSLSAFNLAQSGSGNAVTAVTLSADKKTLTVTKGSNMLLADGSNGSAATTATLINKLGVGDNNINDNMTLVTSNSNPSANTEFYRRPFSYVWTYIKSKTDANYVTLSTAQTITGRKTISGASLKLLGSTASNAANRHTSGLLAFQENAYDDQFGIWGYFSGRGASQKLFIGGSGGGGSLANDQNGTTLTPYLTIEHTTGNLTVLGKIIKSGGTSSQFLMADGSVKTSVDADTLDSFHETSFFRSFISGSITDANILTTLPGNRSGSYSIVHSGWTGGVVVFFSGNSNSGLAFYRPGGSNSIPKILVATDGKSNWVDKGTILTDTSYTSTLDSRYVRSSNTREMIWEWGNTTPTHVWGAKGGDSSKAYVFNGDNIRAFANAVNKAGDTMTGALLMTTAATAPAASTTTALSYGRLQCYGTLNINGNTDNSGTEYVNITAGHGLSSSTADGLSIGTSTLTWQNNKVWHAGNDGSGSGLDADLLDGVHNGELTAALLKSANDVSYDANSPSVISYSDYGAVITRQNFPSQWKFGSIFTLPTHNALNSVLGGQFAWDVNHNVSSNITRHLWFRARNSTTWDSWHEIAFTTSNVASATRLQTNSLFTAWGQTYFANGVPNSISGNMTGVGSISMSGNINMTSGEPTIQRSGENIIRIADAGLVICPYSTSGFIALRGGNKTNTNGATELRLLSNGNVGIGTPSPAYKLDVNGTAHVSSYLNVDGAVAVQNGVRFTYANNRGYCQLGSSSQKNGTISGWSGVALTQLIVDSATTQFNGSIKIGSVTLSYDSSAGALKIDGAAYTTGWFSAKGVGSSAGGTGGSVNFLTAWSSYTSSMANTYALSAGLGYDLHTRLQNVYTMGTCDGRYGSTLTISGSTLTLKSPDGTSLKSVTLPTSSGTTGSYLPLSGGTLTGNLRLKDSTNYGRSLLFGDGSYCYLKEDTDDHLTIYASKGINLSVGSGYNVTINGSAISSGGSSSGNYLPLSGGTMTGKITLMTGDNAIGNSYLFLRTTSANPYLALTTSSTTFYLQAYYSDARGLGLFLGPTSASALLINNTGNVYVASGKQLYVNGTAVTSDARLKTIIGEVSLTVEQIAHAPAINFIWKENGLRSVGSIAQYWRTYLPYTVDVDDMGDKLYLDYSRAALLSAIVTARRVLTVESRMLTAEERIESLAAEVTELKEKLNQYENNNITPNDNEKES